MFVKRIVSLKIVFLLLLSSAFSTNALGQIKPKVSKAKSLNSKNFGNTDDISAEMMKSYLEFIASDELRGRDTPSPGLDIAAKYIATHLKKWGIKPGGEKGTYYQEIPLEDVISNSETSFVKIGDKNYELGKYFISEFQVGVVENAQVVYADHGYVVESENINPFKDIDVKDKIVVVHQGLPKGFISFRDFKGKYGVDWLSPALAAQRLGAKAVIRLGTYGQFQLWDVWLESRAKGLMHFKGIDYSKFPTAVNIPIITASPQLIKAIFEGEKYDGQAVFENFVRRTPVEPFNFKADKKISISVIHKRIPYKTQNVIGILDGSDPVLKNEYVVIGAHYDHVGVNENAPGEDKIWNGADDDGSGTVAIMAMAEAFAKSKERPKRSIMFIWHAGEEKGLWGSEYFTEYPTVPIDSIIANLNIDMIGRSQKRDVEVTKGNEKLTKEDDIYLIGPRLMSTEMEQISEAVNNSFLKLGFNYKYDDPNEPERLFYRSDHYNYAKKGIPVIFYSDGGHVDYHKPSDSVEKIDFGQMEKVTKTIFATAWTLANRAKRPVVDKPIVETDN